MMTKQDNTIKMIKGQYENVATALYLVTNHLKDTEPLKHRVRQISHDILEHMIHLSDMSYVHVENHTLHLQSLLRIASSAGLIAEQNASILSSALQKTLKDMQQYMKSLTNMSISLSDLLYIEPVAEIAEEQNQNSNQNKNPVAQHTLPTSQLQKDIVSPKMSFNGVESMRQAFKTINQGGADAEHPGSQASPSSAKGLSDRQQIIIKELRNKGQLTVKDLAEKIKGCSEKTIQRELLSLVGSGVLKKEGERRWSRYSVK
jgi:hypothetical protein